MFFFIAVLTFAAKNTNILLKTKFLLRSIRATLQTVDMNKDRTRKLPAKSFIKCSSLLTNPFRIEYIHEKRQKYVI